MLTFCVIVLHCWRDQMKTIGGYVCKSCFSDADELLNFISEQLNESK